jgi:hypothetical protein
MAGRSHTTDLESGAHHAAKGGLDANHPQAATAATTTAINTDPCFSGFGCVHFPRPGTTVPGIHAATGPARCGRAVGAGTVFAVGAGMG